jgi:hypothetical protein
MMVLCFRALHSLDPLFGYLDVILEGLQPKVVHMTRMGPFLGRPLLLGGYWPCGSLPGAGLRHLFLLLSVLLDFLGLLVLRSLLLGYCWSCGPFSAEGPKKSRGPSTSMSRTRTAITRLNAPPESAAGDPPRESSPPFPPARCTELNTKIRREPLRTEGAPDLRSPLDALLLSIHGPLDLVAHYVVHPIRRDEELAVAVHRQP